MSFVNTEDMFFINEDYIYNNVDTYRPDFDHILDVSYRLYSRLRRSNIKEIKVTRRKACEYSV